MKIVHSFSVLIIVLTIGLFGCSPSATETTFPVLPNGLKDCNFYQLYEGGMYFYVARCPNNQTTMQYKPGKGSPVSFAVIEN